MKCKTWLFQALPLISGFKKLRIYLFKPAWLGRAAGTLDTNISVLDNCYTSLFFWPIIEIRPSKKNISPFSINFEKSPRAQRAGEPAVFLPGDLTGGAAVDENQDYQFGKLIKVRN